jgi:hypothetical protein
VTDSDDQQNLPAVPDQAGQVAVHSLELPVAEFEGEMVRIMHGKLPGDVLQMDYGYRRGTHLKIELEVEVMRVSVDEVRAGKNKGDLVREHVFKLREAKIVGAYTAEQMDQGVGGSLAATGADVEDEEQETDDRPEIEEKEDDEFDPGF